MAADPSDGSAGDDRGARTWALAYDALGHLGGLILAIMAGAVFLQVVMRFLGSAGSTASKRCRAFSSSGW